MSFHFDARAESSSDDDNIPNLSTWKNSGNSATAAAQSLPAPVAPMIISQQGSYESTLDRPASPSSPASIYHDSAADPVPTQTSGFQAINSFEPEKRGTPLFVSDSESMDHDDNDKSQATRAGLFVAIGRDDVDRSEYEDLTAGHDRVRQVLRKVIHDGETFFEVVFDDYHAQMISVRKLHAYANGREALAAFAARGAGRSHTTSVGASRSRQSKMSSTRPGKVVRRQSGFVDTFEHVTGGVDGIFSDDDDEPAVGIRKRRRSGVQQAYEPEDVESHSEDEVDDLDSDTVVPNRSVGRSLRTRRQQPQDDSDDDSDIGFSRRRKRKRVSDVVRHSERSTRHQGGMREKELDDIFRSDSEHSQPRVKAKPPAVTREIFKQLPRDDEFRMRHNQFCEVCNQGSNAGPLVYCQGCSLSYHKACMGSRSTREHLVTKIAEDDFVLQCRRCVANAKHKDPKAPDQGMCQDCRQHGASCQPFRQRTNPAQEQKAREDNGGIDPICHVDESRINKAENVLFRCTLCFRGFHYNHLPSRNEMMDIDMIEADAEQRFREYSRDWKCKDCFTMPAKVAGLIAWKPIDEDTYDPTLGIAGVEEDEKIYLVRWEGMSYFRARWMPGAWVWGITTASMRKAFMKREGSQHPKMRIEDAIPEDYLRTDIVLDIQFTSIVDIQTDEIDKARIREVDKALIKYKGLGYEDAVWEAPPSPDDGERWSDFVVAYNDWVAGRYVRPPKPSTLRSRLEKARKDDFSKLEKQAQPENMVGGKLMDYQIEGLNWLYYKWFSRENAILADEMGLGKTIQIIAFLATLVQDWSCFPFLVVVPNSTCPNWRREIKRWAPSLRVVAYYGSRESRDLAYRYELFPNGSKDLRCHVVVTSYDAAADENCRKFFRNVQWQGLIVDEGQRLKNDKNMLYAALEAMKAPFKILLTGTPLQNNQRELFNLLHFLDDSFNAAELEAEYEELDPQKVAKLHDMIRPFFLRRTKAQVLTFLPPMAQIIVPVSMTIVQKKLYKSILAKNPDLMRAIFSKDAVKASERSNLSNILMQLRKCLCHPFVYNKSIEDKDVSIAASHRNLVDASSKLKLLELLLPRLKERGHRVLLFSQFLDMLDIVEDFLEGMSLQYQRLDGSINSLEKQKRIDEFNSPDSQSFAFLLSTRAGGVGINLATADTVIILDPDFNPHQDIQALSRAHRIGQKNKVLCFQLVTRASAEERIMQIGRKKLALEHVLIRSMDVEDTDETDLASVLRHGVSELFEGSGEQDINYDALSIERLLDRSHMEETQGASGEAQTAENQFSFARVWANDQGTLKDADNPDEEQAPDPGVWANILKERERLAAEEAAAKAEAFGRGRRARQNVDYAGDLAGNLTGTGVEEPSPKAKSGRKRDADGSDTDFQADTEDEDEEPEAGPIDSVEIKDLDAEAPRPAAPLKKTDKPSFRRVTVPRQEPVPPSAPPGTFGFLNCRACQTFHEQGSCPLKLAGVEFCNLCGIAHYGHARVCPHIQSETQVRAMLEALRYSTEPEHVVSEARRYLRGLKGNLVQMKKHAEAKRLEKAERDAAHQTYSAYPDMGSSSMNRSMNWQY